MCAQDSLLKTVRHKREPCKALTGLVVDVALWQGPRIAAQIAHAVPGQEGGPAEVLAQLFCSDPELCPHLLPYVLLPCIQVTANGQARKSGLR